MTHSCKSCNREWIGGPGATCPWCEVERLRTELADAKAEIASHDEQMRAARARYVETKGRLADAKLGIELAESETAGLRQKIDRLCQDYVDQDKKRAGEVKELDRVIYQLKEKLRLSEEERVDERQRQGQLTAQIESERARLAVGLTGADITGGAADDHAGGVVQIFTTSAAGAAALASLLICIAKPNQEIDP